MKLHHSKYLLSISSILEEVRLMVKQLTYQWTIHLHQISKSQPSVIKRLEKEEIIQLPLHQSEKAVESQSLTQHALWIKGTIFSRKLEGLIGFIKTNLMNRTLRSKTFKKNCWELRTLLENFLHLFNYKASQKTVTVIIKSKAILNKMKISMWQVLMFISFTKIYFLLTLKWNVNQLCR